MGTKKISEISKEQLPDSRLITAPNGEQRHAGFVRLMYPNYELKVNDDGTLVRAVLPQGPEVTIYGGEIQPELQYFSDEPSRLGNYNDLNYNDVNNDLALAEEIRLKNADEHVRENYGAKAWGKLAAETVGAAGLAGTGAWLWPTLSGPVTGALNLYGGYEGLFGERGLFGDKGFKQTKKFWNDGNYTDAAISGAGDLFNIALTALPLRTAYNNSFRLTDNVIRNFGGTSYRELGREGTNLLGTPRETVRLYRANPRNAYFKVNQAENGAAQEKYAGMWFTDDPAKGANYASNYVRGKDPFEGVDLQYVDIPKSLLELYRASKILPENFEYEPNDFIIPFNIRRNTVPFNPTSPPGRSSYFKEWNDLTLSLPMSKGRGVVNGEANTSESYSLPDFLLDSDNLLTNIKTYPDGAITGILPGYKGFAIKGSSTPGKYNLFSHRLGYSTDIADRAQTEIKDLTLDEIKLILAQERTNFNYEAHPVAKEAFNEYANIGRVVESNDGAWTNLDELIDKTPESIKKLLTNIWNNETSNVYLNPKYVERYTDLADETGLTALFGDDFVQNTYQLLVNDVNGPRTPIAYITSPLNGGVSFVNHPRRPWGVNVVSVDLNSIRPTTLHEITHLFFKNRRNAIQPMISKFIRLSGGLEKYRLPRFNNLTKESLQYMGDIDEFHSRIMEGVREMLTSNLTAEQVYNSKIFLKTYLPAYYEKDFLIKCLNKFVALATVGTAGNYFLNNSKNENLNDDNKNS